MVTAVLSNSQIKLNEPFNEGQGGIIDSVWSFDACLSNVAFPSVSFTIESCEVLPGCCGAKVAGIVGAGNFAYHHLNIKHTNQDLRVVLTSSDTLVDLFIRRGVRPDARMYEFKTESKISPWVIQVPQTSMLCASESASSCTSIQIGVRGLPSAGAQISYELATYFEFNFPSFACSESPAAALSSRCAEIGLVKVGDASFVNDVTDDNNAPVMRLTAAAPSQSGAVWWNTKVHLENGFETSFRFRISSPCILTGAPDCQNGDGFALVLHGGDTAGQLGCSGRALGFASDDAVNCTRGIVNSFAVEFDTWHNPELHDMSVRGPGTVSINATRASGHSYAHVAFFSQGANANTVSHTKQMAATPSIPNIADGAVHHARLVYIPGGTAMASGRMFLYIDDMQSFVLTAPVHLARQSSYCSKDGKTSRCILDSFGNAYLGFTSANGQMGQIHDIRSWNFCDEPNCGKP